MPKLKTHSGAKKRFKVTKNGKVKRAHAFKSHLLNNGRKTTKRKRGLRKATYADKTNVAALRHITMARVKGAMMTRKRRKKILKLAKGYFGSKSKHFKMAKQAVYKSGNYAYIGRKQKKRDFRRLWITRISAGCRANNITYSVFINGLKKAGIDLNRKMLSEIAIHDEAAFTALVEKAKAAL